MAESIYEDEIRNLTIIDTVCDLVLDEGKKRGDFTEACLLNELRIQGIAIDDSLFASGVVDSFFTHSGN